MSSLPRRIARAVIPRRVRASVRRLSCPFEDVLSTYPKRDLRRDFFTAVLEKPG